MVPERSHTRGNGAQTGQAPTGTQPGPTPQIHTGALCEGEELRAGCTLSAGFGRLHHQLTGLPTVLQAVVACAERGKLVTILSPRAPTAVATVTHKLGRVPPLLAEWHTGPSLATAHVLCAQARQLFAHVPFTRQFLRAQSRVFHDAVTAGTTGLPAALCQSIQRSLLAAEEQIRVSCHRLVELHLYMVELIAQEYRAVGIPDADVADLRQDGSLALLAAAELFDVCVGARFRTYAMYWLRQAVTRSLRTRRLVLPPRAQQRIARQLTRKTQQLEQLLTRAVSPDELAAATGVLPRDIAAALATQRREISLDAPLGDGRVWADVLAAPDQSLDDNAPRGSEESAYMARLRHSRR